MVYEGIPRSPEGLPNSQPGDIEALRHKVMMDMYYEKTRQHIRNLPLHERLRYINKIMKDEYGLPVKNN